MKIVYSIIFIISFSFGYSQDITAYRDYRGYFYVFDKGLLNEIETLPVKNFKIGQSCIAYQNYQGNLKVYYKGKTYDMWDAVETYYVSKHLAVGVLNSQLKLFDNRKMQTISTNVGTYALSDSLVAFNDNNYLKFNVYYKGAIIQLEDVLVSNAISNFKAAGNIVAYIDTQSDFKVFYHGKVSNMFTFNSSLPLQYDVGQDVVAFIDNDDESFNVIWMGQNYKIEDASPMSFMAGNNFVAYVDNAGTFKIFKDGMVTVISAVTPDFYKVTDNIVVYSEKGFFKADYEDVSLRA